MWTIAKKIPRVFLLSAQTLALLLLYPRPSGQKLIIVRNRDERSFVRFFGPEQLHVVIKTGDIWVYLRRSRIFYFISYSEQVRSLFSSLLYVVLSFSFSLLTEFFNSSTFPSNTDLDSSREELFVCSLLDLLLLIRLFILRCDVLDF